MSQEHCLILRARPETDAAVIAERLQQIAHDAQTEAEIRVCPDADMTRTVLRSDDTATLCQIYTSPERHLCHAVERGQDLAAALADWVGEAREMLALHRQNRRRSLLFEAAHLCRYSDAGLARLGFSSGSMTLNAAIKDLPMNAPIVGLIARAQLQTRPDVMQLREELDVSAQLLSNDAVLIPPLSPELALQTYHAQTLRLAEAEHATDKASRQSALTLESLKLLEAESAAKDITLRERQEQIDRITSERDSLAVQIAKRDAALEANAAQITQMQAEHTRLRSGLAETRTHLDAQRQELDRITSERDAQIADLSRDLDEKRDHAHALEAEIARIMTSRSMRITTPLRRLGALFRRKQND